MRKQILVGNVKIDARVLLYKMLGEFHRQVGAVAVVLDSRQS